MNNDYIVHTAIKCSDGKVHRLSYDLIDLTEGSVREFGRVFTEIEKRFPDTYFCVLKYPDNFNVKDYMDEDECIHFENVPYETISGDMNNIFVQKNITE